MGKSGEKTKGAQLFNDFQNLSRIWTHPRVLQMNADKAERTAERKVLLMNYNKLLPLMKKYRIEDTICMKVFLFIILNCI
jgi:hypothetical protein